MTLKLNILLPFFFLISFMVKAQNDTIRVKNNNVIVGEIKTLVRGVLTMETPYSDKDFQIEYDQITSMIIQRKCVILLTNSRRRFGYLTTNNEGKVEITLDDGTKETFDFDEIVGLNEVKDKFWQRVSANIDLSFNLSKANNLTQFVISGGLNYVDEFWGINGSVNLLNSDQDNSERIKRNDAQLEFIIEKVRSF
ncbi:MAG: hypothetical protein HRU26_15070 [Psychroserpens sp.]|nr:hypothetical protein [Psychroserpens sp.]